MPFNLTAGPLVRVKLIRMGPDEHHVLFTSHHIVCDGWSTNVILDELAKLYNGLSTGLDASSPRRWGSARMRDCRPNTLRAPKVRRTKAIGWSNSSSRPPPLDLPLDRPRPAIKSYDGATMPPRDSR